MIKQLFFIGIGLLVTAGCATMVGDPDQAINISSDPIKAKITITDRNGKQVFIGQTPATPMLKKTDGSYFGGENYRVSISKEGYATQTVNIRAWPNGWYYGGNIAFIVFAPVGWLLVDPFNGEMYTLAPRKISTDLAKEISYREGELRIVLMKDIPDSLRAHLQRIP